jgi:C4-dicarboxylate-specific signal transduction histidine kinase
LLLRLSLKGKSSIAASILLSLLFLATLKTSYSYGVIIPTNILIYALIIFLSGILTKPGYSILWTLTTSIVLIILFYIQKQGIVSVNYNWKSQSSEIIDVIVLCFIYLVIAVMSWLSGKEISKSIKRARVSETEALRLAAMLKKQNLNLEDIVEERTKELRENQLRQLTEISSLADFGKLSAAILHDIKNPLTVLSMNLDSIKEKAKEDDIDLQNLLNKSLLASKTVESIIKTSQKQLIHEEVKESFDVQQEIKNTLLLLDSRANKFGIKLIFNSDIKIKITSYPVKLCRVVANLVMNGIDALEKSKKLRKVINIKLKKINQSILIIITDNGIGIKDEIKNKIFIPAFSTKESNERMGLGLCVSQEIIKNYFCGEINFKSKYKKGSEFTIIFPISS